MRSVTISGCPTKTWKRSKERLTEPNIRSPRVGAQKSSWPMTALEQLGTFVAHSTPPSRRLREILALHTADILGAWIASLPTSEGAALLRWRAASREGAAPGSMHALRLDV